ncbi:radical SAM protein [Fibrobacter sp. UBA3718]|uniref:radical SAM protein n=1 Tax=Fibrobacter sp. UBA3718 TaxID=1946531 RepID=UPI0025C1F7B6|nr:radical SAM protein [Fibrobacter sp. UBA3718]
MEQSIARPAQLTIITTNRCNAACSHCIMCSGKGRKEILTFDQIKNNIDQMKKVSRGPFVLIFTGGEPTLLGEDLFESIAYADSLGIPSRIVTNAHWAKTRQDAERMVQTLAECGLSEINISTDDYHVKYVPFSNVKNAWKACHGKGFHAVIVGVSYSKESKITPEFVEAQFNEKLQRRFNSKERELPLDKRDKDGTIYAISNTWVTKSGRAAEELSDKSFKFKRNTNFFLGKCPTIMSSVIVSPSNHVWACCGFECGDGSALDIGDLSKATMNSIVKKAEKNIVIQAIKYLGPLQLKDCLASIDPDIEFKNKYTCVCALCEDIVKNERALATIKSHKDELWERIKLAKSLSELTKVNG